MYLPTIYTDNHTTYMLRYICNWTIHSQVGQVGWMHCMHDAANMHQCDLARAVPLNVLTAKIFDVKWCCLVTRFVQFVSYRWPIGSDKETHVHNLWALIVNRHHRFQLLVYPLILYKKKCTFVTVLYQKQIIKCSLTGNIFIKI